MTKEFSKAIMNRSWLKIKYLKWSSRKNVLELKKIERLYKKITLQVIRQYLSSLSIKNVTSNKNFWDAVKFFFSN